MGEVAMSAIMKKIMSFGPAFMAVGYTIGTGSVTAMIVAGSTFGMQLLWVLLLSCLFSGALVHAYGKYSLVTGETALYAFKQHLKFGKLIAIAVIIGVVFGQWNSLIGIMGISSNIIYELLALYFPSLVPHKYGVVLAIAVIVISVMYGVLLIGKYSLFEKILIFFVTCMGLSFVISLFFIHPLPAETIAGLVPTIPEVEGGKMLVAAFVGTTMAAATFLSRPLFIKGKGWTIENSTQQKKDAIVAALLVFVISGSIMAVAHGVLFHEGKPVTKVLDMVNALEPVAGKMSLSIFFFGTLAAGLSSIFPILLIAPLLIADYQTGELDTTSRQFKVITGFAAVLALAIPVLGANPIKGQILTQVFNVFILPVVVGGMLVLMNNPKLMKSYKAGWVLNTLLGLALLFSVIISYNGVVAIIASVSG